MLEEASAVVVVRAALVVVAGEEMAGETEGMAEMVH